MMLKRIAIAAAFATAPLLVPSAAQAQAQNGVLVIYGDDKCPTNENGEEIVICQRLDEAERFRIPENLRETEGRPQANQSWAVRSQSALEAGQMGTGSCSTVGASGRKRRPTCRCPDPAQRSPRSIHAGALSSVQSKISHSIAAPRKPAAIAIWV